MATVNIHRVETPAEGFCSYKIYIDGKKTGKIKKKEVKEFEIPAGKHRIFFKSRWFKSPEIEFDISDNEKKQINVYKNFSSVKSMLGIFIPLITAKIFIHLFPFKLNFINLLIFLIIFAGFVFIVNKLLYRDKYFLVEFEE